MPAFGNPVDGTGFSDLAVNRSNSVDGPAVRPYLADADTLFLPTEAANVKGKMRAANQVVAIDLASGKVTVLAEGPQSAGTEGEDAKIIERDGIVVIVPWKHVVADAAITVMR